MVALRVALPPATRSSSIWQAVRDELHITDAFPQEVLDEAETAAAKPLDVEGRVDCTGLDFFTLDPDGSMDLDQAMYLEAQAEGFRVHYAIADVGYFVAPGSALDLEAHRRGETLYAPDVRVSLYPPRLSEGAASLLPDETRPAVVWKIDLDKEGNTTSVDVKQAIVRSRRKRNYDEVSQLVDSGLLDQQLELLRTIGTLLQKQATQRGAVDLPTLEQRVEQDGDTVTLTYRAQTLSEGWNEQISLLTGRAAAALMVNAKLGLLRTMPAPEADAVSTLRRSARSLGVAWGDSESYGEVISRADSRSDTTAAFLVLAARLLRGAAYVAFDGELPANTFHSGVAAPYAHCTAPLRRLGDRYVSELCLALCGETEVPSFVKEALIALPAEMQEADRRAHTLERTTVDVAETLVLEHRIGEVFDAVVVEQDEKKTVVQLSNPAVRGRATGTAVLGKATRVQLAQVDMAKRTVTFTIVQ